MQKTGGPILTICVSYDVFLRKELPFGDHNNCACVKIYGGINFFNRDEFLDMSTRSLTR